jgi:hypothetical protein
VTAQSRPPATNNDAAVAFPFPDIRFDEISQLIGTSAWLNEAAVAYKHGRQNMAQYVNRFRPEPSKELHWVSLPLLQLFGATDKISLCA